MRHLSLPSKEPDPSCSKWSPRSAACKRSHFRTASLHLSSTHGFGSGGPRLSPFLPLPPLSSQLPPSPSLVSCLCFQMQTWTMNSVRTVPKLRDASSNPLTLPTTPKVSFSVSNAEMRPHTCSLIRGSVNPGHLPVASSDG